MVILGKFSTVVGFQQFHISSNGKQTFFYHLFSMIRFAPGEFSFLWHDAQYCEW